MNELYMIILLLIIFWLSLEMTYLRVFEEVELLREAIDKHIKLTHELKEEIEELKEESKDEEKDS